MKKQDLKLLVLFGRKIFGVQKKMFWGKETVPFNVNRYGDPKDRSSLELLATSHFQLYVNPEGVEGKPDPVRTQWMCVKLLEGWE